MLEKDLINDVIHCKSLEAPTALVAAIYTQLTGREVKLFAAASDAAALPTPPTSGRTRRR